MISTSRIDHRTAGNGPAIRAMAAVGLLSVITACASTRAPDPLPAAEAVPGASYGAISAPSAVVAVAAELEGAPYRYGGASPRGFDCSGFVHYSFRKAGLRVPRTTSEQMRRATPISLASIRPGDLLFFRLEGAKVSHVGIYVGGNRFIHAPSTGKRVSYASLANPYWRKRLVGAGRYV